MYYIHTRIKKKIEGWCKLLSTGVAPYTNSMPSIRHKTQGCPMATYDLVLGEKKETKKERERE